MNNDAMNIIRDTRPEAITLVKADAQDLDGNAVTLRVSCRTFGNGRVRSGFVVTWNARRAGFGWKRGFNATTKTEAEALAFADTKIETLRGWFARQAAA